MSAQRLIFNDLLQPAVELGALTPLRAWKMELMLESDLEPTQQYLETAEWLTLVYAPPWTLQAH